MVLFSIIIPAHNEEKYLDKTVQSIKKQSLHDYEVIIVTNGCTDKTEEVAKKLADDQISCLSLPRPNVSVARNAGALNSKGRILIFLDADTQLAPDTLEKIKGGFTEDISVATTTVKPDLPSFSYRLTMNFKNLHNYFNIYQGCSGVLICRKKDFQQAGGYNPEITVKEHRKLTLQLLKRGNYSCIKTPVITSMRRYQNWGITKATKFWIEQWLRDKQGRLKDTVYETIR